MDKKLRKVKQPSRGLKWYIIMWTITIVSAFLSGYFIHERTKWKKSTYYWHDEYRKLQPDK